MKRFAPLAMAAALVAVGLPASAIAQTSAATAGQTLYDASGARIGKVYRINSEGDPQVILNGKLVTVPASTLSSAQGKLTTSLAKKEIGRRS